MKKIVSIDKVEWFGRRENVITFDDSTQIYVRGETHPATERPIEQYEELVDILCRQLKESEVGAPDISTKENNDAPVDILTWVNNFIKKSPLRYTSDGGLPINDDLRLATAVEFGEQNDRKRTQPYLEAYEDILRTIRQGKVGVAGLYSSVYYDVYFGAKDIDDQYQSLQQLLKKENDND
jgi:hypothetical protein